MSSAPDTPLHRIGAMILAQFDIAVGQGTLVDQNDGRPLYDITASSIFNPESNVSLESVEPRRLWNVATIGEAVTPIVGFFVPGYDFPTDEGWVWFALYDRIDFRECDGNRPEGDGDDDPLDRVVSALIDRAPELVARLTPPPTTEEAREIREGRRR